jgi:molybdate transport system permease protein
VRRAAVPVTATLAFAVLILPLLGLLQRAPWSTIGRELGRPEARQALGLSLGSSLGALAVSLCLGLPLAWVLARVPFRGRSLVRALVTLPMVLPPVVGGVGLLSVFGRRGLVGAHIGSVPGFPLPFTVQAVVLAQVFVAMPFLVVAAEAGLRQLDGRYEEAASTLGARPWHRFRTVTVPLVAPSLVAGGALAWARALGEFGATVTFAGSLPGRTRTLPTAIYAGLQSRPESAIALSVVLLAVSLTVLVALRGNWLGSR